MNKNIHDGPNAALETNGLRNELFELSQYPHIPSLTQRMVFLDIDTFSVRVKKFSVNHYMIKGNAGKTHHKKSLRHSPFLFPRHSLFFHPSARYVHCKILIVLTIKSQYCNNNDIQLHPQPTTQQQQQQQQQQPTPPAHSYQSISATNWGAVHYQSW